MADPGTKRISWDDVPPALRANLEKIAKGEKVDGHHGYRAGPWLKLVGLLLGLVLAAAAIGAVVAAKQPLPAEWVLGIPAGLGFLLVIRNARRLATDPGLKLSRWAFVTPSLVMRVEHGGRSVLVDRLAHYTQQDEKPGIRARQQEGDITYFSGTQRVRISGFESVTALVEFSEAIAEGVKHVKARADDSEDAWLEAADPARAPALPGKLAIALALTLVAFLLGGAAVAIAVVLR